MSPVITSCVFEVSGKHCVYIQLFQSHRFPPACSVWLAVWLGGADSCHCTRRHCPQSCLSVCLPVYFSLAASLSANQSACLLVSPCSCSFMVPVLLWGLVITDVFSHSALLVSGCCAEQLGHPAQCLLGAAGQCHKIFKLANLVEQNCMKRPCMLK